MKDEKIMFLLPLTLMMLITVSGVGFSGGSITMDNDLLTGIVRGKTSVMDLPSRRSVDNTDFYLFYHAENVSNDVFEDTYGYSKDELGYQTLQMRITEARPLYNAYILVDDDIPLSDAWYSFVYGRDKDDVVSILHNSLDAAFGDQSGHRAMAETIWEKTEEYHQAIEPFDDPDKPPYGETGKFIHENYVREILEVKPETLEELEALDSRGLSVGDTLVFVGLLVGLVLLSGVVGIRVFGSGISDVSVGLILRFTFFFVLWGILSFQNMEIITALPLVGSFFWLILTLIYTLGVLMDSELI